MDVNIDGLGLHGNPSIIMYRWWITPTTSWKKNPKIFICYDLSDLPVRMTSLNELSNRLWITWDITYGFGFVSGKFIPWKLLRFDRNTERQFQLSHLFYPLLLWRFCWMKWKLTHPSTKPDTPVNGTKKSILSCRRLIDICEKAITD